MERGIEMNTYKFYWSPEGRCIATYQAKDAKKATMMFVREFSRSYARYMGEVYWVLANSFNKPEEIH